MFKTKKILIAIITGFTMFVLTVSLTSVAKATPVNNQVRLCHHTEGGHYNDITVDNDAVFQQGHDQHQGGQDIIPPFSYQVWEVTGTQMVCPNGYPNPSTGHPGFCYKNGGSPDWPEDYRAKVSQDVYGWVTHNFSGKNWDTAGQATWNNGCVVPITTVDLCTNLDGDQETMPCDYEDPDQDKICTLIEDPKDNDLCTNLEGDQETMPENYEDPDKDGVCTLIKEEDNEEVDLCPNIDKVQTTVPEGYFIHDKTKECIAYTHGDKPKTEVQPETQILGATTDTESLPVGGGEWLFYQSLLAAFGFLIMSALVTRYMPKQR